MSIEEDIKNMHDFMKACVSVTCEYILKKMQELQKQINEEHQKLNRELREKIKKLEEINKELMNEYHKRVQEKIDLSQELEETISKQKIKDKIAGLKQDIENGKTRYPYILEHKIDILQELLQESEDK